MQSVLVVVGSAPYGTENAFAGLRCAVSLRALGLVDRVDAVLVGEGVLNALTGQSPTTTLQMPSILSTLEELALVGVSLYLVQEDLEALTVSSEALDERVQLITRTQLPELLDRYEALLYY